MDVAFLKESGPLGTSMELRNSWRKASGDRRSCGRRFASHDQICDPILRKCCTPRLFLSHCTVSRLCVLKAKVSFFFLNGHAVARKASDPWLFEWQQQRVGRLGLRWLPKPQNAKRRGRPSFDHNHSHNTHNHTQRHTP